MNVKTIQTPRLSAESLTQIGAQRRVVLLGFTKEQAIRDAVNAALAEVPEEKRADLRTQFGKALGQNELAVSFGMKDGIVDPSDWMITAGNPAIVERPTILGGASKVPAIGRGGTSYLQTKVRANYGLLNGALKALGITRVARQPAQNVGNGFQYDQGASQGQTEGQTQDEDVTQHGGEDYPV